MSEMNYEILINRENKLEEDYYTNVIKPSLVTVTHVKNNDVMFQTFGVASKKVYLEEETSEQFEQLRNFTREHGIFFDISCGFLTPEQQGRKYDRFLQKYGREFAEQSACLPYYSEHNTGLAADTDIYKDGKWGKIAPDEDGNINEETTWIHTVLHKFGFILRYPKGKEDITKLKFEPWHIRYVRKELAEYIYENQLTLEEYYDKKK